MALSLVIVLLQMLCFGILPRSAGLFPAVVAGGLLLVWWLWLFRMWRRSCTGWLHWDAQAPGVDDLSVPGGWRWAEQAAVQGAGEAVRVECVLDLQSRVLLCLRGRGGVRWVWAEAALAPAFWRDLRRAVQAHAA